MAPGRAAVDAETLGVVVDAEKAGAEVACKKI